MQGVLVIVEGTQNHGNSDTNAQTKFQIPVGIPQNSEFFRKLLPIRPEPRYGVLIFFNFTRPEPMNLD
jgi:hypothetical protein